MTNSSVHYTYIKVDLQFTICIEPASLPWGTHIFLGAIRESMQVKAFVAKWTLTLPLLEIFARLVTVKNIIPLLSSTIMKSKQ